MTKHLTPAMKSKYLPVLIARDGFLCLYCRQYLASLKYIFEHLDDNRDYNEIENIVLSCRACNNKKPSDQEMKKMALEKLHQNKKGNFMRERKNELDSANEASPEIEINVRNSDIVRSYIEKEVDTKGSIEYSEALHSVTYLCKQKTGHGSQQSVRNYIAALTSVLGPLMITRDDSNKKIIVMRQQSHQTPPPT